MSPRRYAGWEPSTTTSSLPDGRTRTVREPEWDWIDRAIVNAWLSLQRDLCALCGRPLAVHEDDDEGDYDTGYFTCTATLALDKAQARRHEEDAPERKRGHNPERARQWVTWTQAEGPPTP